MDWIWNVALEEQNEMALKVFHEVSKGGSAASSGFAEDLPTSSKKSSENLARQQKSRLDSRL